jgi:hypothetical protein
MVIIYLEVFTPGISVKVQWNKEEASLQKDQTGATSAFPGPLLAQHRMVLCVLVEVMHCGVTTGCPSWLGIFQLGCASHVPIYSDNRTLSHLHKDNELMRTLTKIKTEVSSGGCVGKFIAIEGNRKLLNVC